MLQSSTKNQCKWLGGGAEDDVILGTRVAYARNIADYPFVNQTTRQQAARIEELLRTKLEESSLSEKLDYFRLTEVDSLTRKLLLERKLIGALDSDTDGPRGVAFDRDESLCLLINEEDHLEIRAMTAGLDLDDARDRAREADEILADLIPYAFSARYGYLTACPTKVGTGMRASIFLHLPALGMGREMQKVLDMCHEHDMRLDGQHPRGSYASADLYRLSNQITLGQSEETILDQLNSVVKEVAGKERRTREVFLNRDREQLVTKIEHALTLLRTARQLSADESLSLLSQLRMGAEMGLVENVTSMQVSELLLLTLPAHLRTMNVVEDGQVSEDRSRARYLRWKLNSENNRPNGGLT